jgi:hypothetical protein
MKPHRKAARMHKTHNGRGPDPRTKRTHPFRGVRMCGWLCVCGLEVCGAEARARLRGIG